MHTKNFLPRILRGSLRRVFAKDTLLCALALLPGSILVFAQLPPLWRDNDSLGQIAGPPGHFTFLQFPALYPFVSRLPILLVSACTRVAAGQPLAMDIHARVLLNDGGTYLLIATQHLALIFALALFIVTAARSFWRRVLLVVLALATPVLFLSAHLISSEALGVILMIFLITIALQLLQTGAADGPALAVFGIFLYLNIMTRHVSAVFAALLPIAYLIALILPRGAESSRYWWRKTWRAAAVGAVAILCAHLTTVILCVVFNEPYRSIVSRTAIYRFDEIDNLPPAERAAFISSMQDKTSDPVIKEAIPRILEVKGYWSHSLLEIDRLIRAHYPPMNSRNRRKMADADLAQIVGLFYSSTPSFLVTDIKISIASALLRASNKDVADVFLEIGVDSLHLYRSEERMRSWTAHLATCSPEAAVRIAAFEQRSWLGGANRIPCGLLLFASMLAAIALTLAQRFPRWRLLGVGAIFAVNLLVMTGTFAVSPYAERQILPECIFAFASVAIVLGGAGQRCEN